VRISVVRPKAQGAPERRAQRNLAAIIVAPVEIAALGDGPPARAEPPLIMAGLGDSAQPMGALWNPVAESFQRQIFTEANSSYQFSAGFIGGVRDDDCR